MAQRFNHMEITFPMGALTTEFCDDVDAFYSDVFGWTSARRRMFGQDSLTLRTAENDFILLIEGKDEMVSPGFDHLGLRLDTRQEVDDTLARVKRRLESDDRIELKEYDDDVMDGELYHAYYVRHLLPIWFDVQFVEPAPVG
ncbi:MAG TPA: VOC family protein [Acidimicrobiales bacterium]